MIVPPRWSNLDAGGLTQRKRPCKRTDFCDGGCWFEAGIPPRGGRPGKETALGRANEES